jgi:hypothetical protein
MVVGCDREHGVDVLLRDPRLDEIGAALVRAIDQRARPVRPDGEPLPIERGAAGGLAFRLGHAS